MSKTVTQPQQNTPTNNKPATATQVPASARPKSPVNTQEAASRITAIISPPAEEKPAAPKKPAAAAPAKPKPAQAPKKAAKEPDPFVDDAADNEDPLNAQDEGADDDAASDEAGTADANDETADPETADGDNSETTEEPETIHSIVIDGKEVKVSHEELVKGYLRQADYTRKTETLAKERKSLQSIQEQVKDLPTVQKTYQEGAERFSKNAQLVMVALEQRFMPQQPDAALLESNPGAYIQQKEHFQEAQQFRAGLQQEFKNLENLHKQEQEKLINEGRKKLFEAYPEMKDAPARQKLKAYANAHGFTDEQIRSEPNHVLFIWADKARKYDEIMAAKAAISPDKSVPKVSKQTRAPEGHKAQKIRERTSTIDQHKQTKSVDSAARAIAGLGLV